MGIFSNLICSHNLNPENSQDLSELSVTLVTSSGTQNDLVVFLMGFILFLHKGGVAARQKHSINCVYIPRLKELLYIYIYIRVCVCVQVLLVLCY